MEITTAIADLTKTPTTKSTGRDASAPGVGSRRTVIMGVASAALTAFVSWLFGMFEPTASGFIIRVDFVAAATALGLAMMGGADYLRRKSAEIVVAAKYAAATE